MTKMNQSMKLNQMGVNIRTNRKPISYEAQDIQVYSMYLRNLGRSIQKLMKLPEIESNQFRDTNLNRYI